MGVSVYVRGVVLLSCACLLTGGAARAEAARTVEVCASRAGLYDAPGRAIVGVVHRGDLLTVLPRRARHRGWLPVGARFGTRGWIRSRYLCSEDPS